MWIFDGASLWRKERERKEKILRKTDLFIQLRIKYYNVQNPLLYTWKKQTNRQQKIVITT